MSCNYDYNNKIIANRYNFCCSNHKLLQHVMRRSTAFFLVKPYRFKKRYDSYQLRHDNNNEALLFDKYRFVRVRWRFSNLVVLLLTFSLL